MVSIRKRVFPQRLDPVSEEAYNIHRMAWNRKNVGRLAPVAVAAQAVFLGIAPWTGCGLWYRYWGLGNIAVFAFCWFMTYRGSLTHDLAWVFGISQYTVVGLLTYHRLGSMINTYCAEEAWEDEAYVLLNTICGIAILSRYIRLSSNGTICLMFSILGSWFIQIMALGSHQSAEHVAKVSIFFVVIVLFLMLGSVSSDKALRQQFNLNMRFKEQEMEFWSMLQTASVPIVRFDTRKSEDNHLDEDIYIIFWNDAMATLSSMQVPSGTSIDDVLPLSFAHSFRLAIEAAINPAKQAATRQLIIPFHGTRGTTWLSFDVWPVARAGLQHVEAMAIGLDVSEFVSKHTSLLRLPPQGPSFNAEPEGGFDQGCLGVNASNAESVDESTSDVDSAGFPSSTKTEQVFRSINERLLSSGSSSAKLIEESLEQISKLGRKEHWLLMADQLEHSSPKKVLGSGTYGIVEEYLFHGTPVAVKSPRIKAHASETHPSTRSTSHASVVCNLLNELRVLRRVRHPNIVLYHGAFMFKDCGFPLIALVFELIVGSSLDKYLATNRVPIVARHKIMLDVCCALRYLHSHDPLVCHGDIKDSNILIENWQVGPRARMVDFGLAHILASNGPIGGTRRWAAPEIIREEVRALMPSSDVYSFALLAYMISTGLKPFFRLHPTQITNAFSAGHCLTLDWIVTDPLSNHVKTVCANALAWDIDRRPAISEIHTSLLTWNPCDTSEDQELLTPFEIFLRAEIGKQDPDSCVMWCDALSTTLCVLGATHSMQQVCGFKPGCLLARWVVDFKDLQILLQSMVSEFAFFDDRTEAETVDLVSEVPCKSLSSSQAAQVHSTWTFHVVSWIPIGSQPMDHASAILNSGCLVQAHLLNPTIICTERFKTSL